MISGKERTPALCDVNCFVSSKRQKTFCFNPEELQKLITNTAGFEYVKEIAALYLEKSVNDHLDILMLENKCDYLNVEQFGKNIFTWIKKDYLKRSEQENIVWIDIKRLQAKEAECLERFKLRTELSEVKAFLKLILQALLPSDERFDLETLVLKPLREVQQNSCRLEALYTDNKELKQILKNQKDYIKERYYTKSTQPLLLGIEESLTKAEIWNRIQARFETNWYQCLTAQVQFKSDLQKNNFRKQIDEIEFKIISEEISGNTIRNTYYALIEKHKHAIEELQHRFNVKVDEIDNKNNYTRTEISKMAELQKSLRNEIERFREDIKVRLEKEKRERERQELESRKQISKRKKRVQKKVKQKSKK